MQRLLHQYSDRALDVLVVWEPILATDWTSPSGSTLARISDPRARQFWDPDHIIAQELGRMAKQHPSVPEPDCCRAKGFYWDDVILYAPHEQWKDGSAPVFWNGPVYRVIPGLEKALLQQP